MIYALVKGSSGESLRIVGRLVESGVGTAVLATSPSAVKKVGQTLVASPPGSDEAVAFLRIPEGSYLTVPPSGWDSSAWQKLPSAIECAGAWEKLSSSVLVSSDAEKPRDQSASSKKLPGLEEDLGQLSQMWQDSGSEEEESSDNDLIPRKKKGNLKSKGFSPSWRKGKWSSRAGNLQVQSKEQGHATLDGEDDRKGPDRREKPIRDAPLYDDVHDDESAIGQKPPTISKGSRRPWWLLLRRSGLRRFRGQSWHEGHQFAPSPPEAHHSLPSQDSARLREGSDRRLGNHRGPSMDIEGLHEEAALGKVQGHLQMCHDGRASLRVPEKWSTRSCNGSISPEHEMQNPSGNSGWQLGKCLAPHGAERPSQSPRIW